ncbi:uncharacterized protein LOC131667647 [Phymastichus coffea]|uniref:uncharacterized protein LOC131667647 n=1 Tax=Phymastichus coffea TaxID=108790 RepID=UPI00273AB4B2|nr:uncharacterized protein LOC131667647 [Phymastichus coffea]
MDFSRILQLTVCLYAAGTLALWDPMEVGEDQCDIAIREIVNEDRATIVDESATRLHAVWISQECEIRVGPEFVIRKYIFFENGTFVLMRHYYAEESCSIATHTVTARGVIKLHDNSLNTPGATEARYHLDTVHVSPLNRQVAHKLGHRVNVSCGPQPRWRPYVAQLIYERAPERFWQGPRYNSLQGQSAVSSGIHSGILRSKTVNCLAPLGIDFDELKLLRVQRKPTGFRSAKFGAADKTRVELYLGALPQDQASKRSHRPSSLQPIALLRTDTIHNCPICGAISRGTENSPPLLHEVVALPAILGGSWISTSCESHPGGVFLRRQLRVYGGDKLWTGRWDFFNDPRCVNFLYSITAAGSYVQRARRHRRHDSSFGDNAGEDFITAQLMSRDKRSTEKKSKKAHEITKKIFNKKETPRPKRELDEIDYYRHLLHSAQPSMADSFAQMLRGNQRREHTTKRPLQSPTPTGTTELDLHVAESLLIIGDASTARRCGAVLVEGSKVPRLSSWPSGCVPHSLDSPSTLGLRARISVDWYGQYTLLLGGKDKGLWDAPLMQCGPTSMKNPLLRSHLRRSVGLRFGILFNKANVTGLSFSVVAVCQVLLLWFAVYVSR